MTEIACDYQGYEFGANYLDSICIDGFLWDADSGNPGEPLEHGGELSCPQCNHDTWLRDIAESVSEEGWCAGYEGAGVKTCPYPKEGAKYHQESDGAVFRFVWLAGYDQGVAEKRSDDTAGEKGRVQTRRAPNE